MFNDIPLRVRQAARRVHNEAWNNKAQETDDLDEIRRPAEDAAWLAARQDGAINDDDLIERYVKHLSEHRRHDSEDDGYEE